MIEIECADGRDGLFSVAVTLSVGGYDVPIHHIGEVSLRGGLHGVNELVIVGRSLCDVVFVTGAVGVVVALVNDKVLPLERERYEAAMPRLRKWSIWMFPSASSGTSV